jgi:hypothetical protein
VQELNRYHCKRLLIIKKTHNGFKTGYNEVILNKSVFQNTGTYFYRLTLDKYSAVKRLQFVAE